MFQLAFRLKHDCEFNRLSKKYPKAVIAHWCNFVTEYLDIESDDPETASKIRRDLIHLTKRGFRILRENAVDDRTQMVSLTCNHRRESSIDNIIEQHRCLLLHPVLYHDGWEHYRIIAFDEKKLPKMFRSLEKEGEVKIIMKRRMNESVRESFIVSTDELFSKVTKKQAEALLTALEHGYYKVPRKIRFEDIAKLRKTPRTTFEEHVRKAESKIMISIAPYISMHLSKPKGGFHTHPRNLSSGGSSRVTLDTIRVDPHL